MNKKGFTLEELIAVVVVLGIIILIAIPGINMKLFNSKREAFKATCDKIYAMDEKFDLYQELAGIEKDCVIFDFDNKTIIDVETNEVYENLEASGIEVDDDITGKFRICKTKKLNISNDKFTCVYDKNNERVLKKSEVDVPLLLSAEVTPTANQISVAISAEGADKYFYKIGNSDYVEKTDSTHTFTGLNEDTEYVVKVYVEKSIKGEDEGLKSDTKTYKVRTVKSPYEGIPQGDYTKGDVVRYGDVDFYVVNDNGDSVTLITKSNVKTGAFGETSSWANSSNNTYLNTTWVQAHPKIASDIENDGIVFSNTSNSYVRMIEKDELDTHIPNDSNMPFWTMTSDGNDVYYGIKTGTGQITKYTLSSTTTQTYYQGTSETFDDANGIKKTFEANEAIESKVWAKALPNSSSFEIGDTRTLIDSVTGKDSYTHGTRVVEESCNCTTQPSNCHNVVNYQTTYSTSTEYEAYCYANYSTCAGQMTNYGWWCGGYAQISTGQHGGQCTNRKHDCVDKQAYSCPGGRPGNMDCTHDVHYSCNVCVGYAPITIDYGDGNCTDDRWAGQECNTTSRCATPTSSIKAYHTFSNVNSTTTNVCDSTTTTCQTCSSTKTVYDAAGNDVTYSKYTVSSTTENVIGIRAVITVKENSAVIQVD